MYEASVSPATAVWIEKYEGGSRNIGTATRFSPPAFPAGILIKFRKSGNNYKASIRLNWNWIEGSTFSYTGSTTYNGIVINNDDGINTFTADFDDFRIRKYTSPEPAISVSSVEEIVYFSSGTYFSQVKDTFTSDATIYQIVWSADLPPQTTAEFYVRASATAFTLTSSMPSWNTAIISSPGIYDLTIPGSNRYQQYKVELKSNGTTSPLFISATLYYEIFPVPVESTNSR